ncbi:hypothetical protein M409DRAFT_70814 [Zasmidium cellare ATCC 36951]|uniref:SMP-30/Gluconolactonase/LRE-like region domain-containing protein n=1 Tax=Zasmidium cellare ATCC 36951 TaxID=1080233 RepID=A0A6A6C1R4_ZASCE|nr:uncharacterized protein M409DRAFT_70814 [Zasmidium cellare ATCC 36951]KAF2159762.1 hypothetical protein M409DRAFT_70814 [Zasmidium cellare ATCC 36951]
MLSLISLALLASTTYGSDLVAEVQDGRFTFYEMPTPLAGPCDLAYNPVDGNLYGEQQLINQLFMINPRTGRVTEYPIPFTTGASNATLPTLLPSPVGDRLALSCAIRDGADGNIYASNGLRNQLVQLNTRTKRIRIFQNPPNPLGNLFPFNDLYTDKTGMWVTQTTGNLLQYFRYRTETFENYVMPTPLVLPLGVFVASDGIVYGCEVLGNAIFTFDPKTKTFREYALPLPLQTPAVVRSEKNGWVYFTLLTGRGMGRINMRSKKIELYPVTILPGFGSVTTGPTDNGRGGVWMSFFANTDAFARFDDRTLTYSYVRIPDAFDRFLEEVPGLNLDLPTAANIAVNYKPGEALWFGSFTRNVVGRYSLRRGE